MAKTLNLKKLRKVTQSSAPVEQVVKWPVLVTEQNINELKELVGKQEIQIDEFLELEGQVFIKRLTFEAQQEVSKAFEWDVVKDPENPELKGIDGKQLVASRLVGSICEDEKGTPFFESIQDVYISEPNFINAIYEAANKVNNFTGKSLKKSSTKTSSGASSSSTESEAEQSPKRGNRSPSKSRSSGQSTGNDTEV